MDDLRQGTLSLTAAGLALGGDPPPASPSRPSKQARDSGDLRTQPQRSAYDGKDRVREVPNGNISGGEDVGEDDEEPPLELVRGRSPLGESVASEKGGMSGNEDGESEEVELFSPAKRSRAEGANAVASGSGTRIELARAVSSAGARTIQLEMDDDWGSPVDETEVNIPFKDPQQSQQLPPSSKSASPFPALGALPATSSTSDALSRPRRRSPRKNHFSIIIYTSPKKRPRPLPSKPVAEPRPSAVDASSTMALDDSEEEPGELANKFKRAGMSANSKARRAAVESDGEDELTIVPSKPSAKDKGKGKKAPETLVLSDTSDEDTLPPPSRTKRVAPSRRRIIAQSDSDSSDDNRLPPKRRSTTSSAINKRPALFSSKRAVVLADSDSSEDLPTVSQLTSAKRRTLPSTSKSANLKRAFASSSRSSPKKRIESSLSSQKKKRGERRSSDEEESESDGFIVEDDEMLGSRSMARRARSKTRKKVVAKSGKGKGKARAIRSSDEDDLELSGKETVLTDRLRVFSPANNSKFEQLRASRSQLAEKREKAATQRRSGVVESSDEALTASRALPRYAGGQLSESSVDDPEDDVEDSTSQDDANLDADLEGFLVEGEEDEETKKVVDRHREEVRERAQGLRFFLKSYLQYIVHVILCPEVDWLEDEAFKTAYEAVTKERKGLLSSLIGSSAWKVKFKAAIDAYPRFGLENLFGFDRGAPCDACSMGAHRASTLRGELLGDKYDEKTFEPIRDSDHSSEDSDSDGEPRAPPPREFNLGKHCAGRAQVYHEIQHWPYEMYETLLGHVHQSVPKVRAPVGGSKEERKKERERLLELDSAEAERCSVLLEEIKVIPNLAKAFLDMVSKAKSDFIR